MKNKLTKIITATMVSAMSLTALGVTANGNTPSKIQDKTIQNYSQAKSIEAASAKTPNKNIGKIVETSAGKEISYQTSGRPIQFLNNDISEAEIENKLTLPENIEKLNLFILTTTPYINFSNSDDQMQITVKFNSSEIENNNTENKDTELANQMTMLNSEQQEKLNTYNLKRSILMIYANELYNNNVNLSNQTKTEINNYLSTLSNENTNARFDETKLDEKISAIESITGIIERNLNNSSMYYGRNLSTKYNSFIENASSEIDTITETSTNQEIANKIVCVLNNKCKNNVTTLENRDKTAVLPATNSTETRQNNSTVAQTQNRSQTQNQSNTQNNLNAKNTQNNNSNNNFDRQNSNSGVTRLNDNNYHRLPNSVRSRRRFAQNNSVNSSALDITETQNTNPANNENNYNLRNNDYMQQNSKTMRADRTNENLSQEKYTNTDRPTSDFNKATRVPYQATTNTFQR